MECCCRLLKYLVFLVNFFVTLAGLTLIVLATMSLITINKGLLDQEAEGDVNILYWAAVVMIALGIIMTIIGFLGCCGASRESQCLLGTYSVVMLIGIGLAVAGTVMVNREKDNIAAKVKSNVEKLFGDVSKNVKAAIALQETLECCGAVDYNDWNKPALVNQFPASCCSKRDSKSCKDPFRESVTSSEAKKLYHDGCVKVAEKMFKRLLDSSPVILGVVILIQALAFIVSLVLCCSIRNNTYKTTIYHN